MSEPLATKSEYTPNKWEWVSEWVSHFDGTLHLHYYSSCTLTTLLSIRVIFFSVVLWKYTIKHLPYLIGRPQTAELQQHHFLFDLCQRGYHTSVSSRVLVLAPPGFLRPGPQLQTPTCTHITRSSLLAVGPRAAGRPWGPTSVAASRPSGTGASGELQTSFDTQDVGGPDRANNTVLCHT